MKIIVPSLVLCCALAVHAQTLPTILAERAGCILKASAYIDPARLPGTKYNPAERFNLNLFQPSDTPYHWEFTLPNEPDYPYTNVFGGFGSPSWKTQKQATIRATLRQFDTYEEKVTFKDIDLAPLKSSWGGKVTPRVLSLPDARSFTTPSGITVTLPAQSYDAIPNVMAGNPNELFIRVEVTPNAKSIAALPDSPLWRKLHRPVTLQLGVTASNEQWVQYVSASPSYGRLALPIPHLATATHLDELTFFVRQRVDLQAIPVQIQVPIYKPAPVKVARRP